MKGTEINISEIEVAGELLRECGLESVRIVPSEFASNESKTLTILVSYQTAQRLIKRIEERFGPLRVSEETDGR